MFPRSAQACSLTARRRLALGGLAVTGALVAGAFVSTPAFAADAATINSFQDLSNHLAAGDTDLVLGADLNSATDTGSDGVFYSSVTSNATLDLAGHTLTTDEVRIGDGVTFTVKDSTATADQHGTGKLDITSDGVQGVDGVEIGANATFHVTGADVSALGYDGGAGIGSVHGTSAHLIADGDAGVDARDYRGSSIGGAGIGGSIGQPGIDVAISDGASVLAMGGSGAAGVGGGSGAAGGTVRLAADGNLNAQQGDPVDPTVAQSSAIGPGEGGTGFGSLTIAAGGDLDVDADHPLRLTSTALENNGTIELYQGTADGTATAVRGAGSIDNLGTVIGWGNEAAGGGNIDPTPLIDSGIPVTGYNYDLTVDANGGTLTAATATKGHLLSSSLRDLLGYQYQVEAPSSSSEFTKWNTKADGSGTDVVDGVAGDLAPIGVSTGAAIPVTLYATFAADPVAPVADRERKATVKLGHALHLALVAKSTLPVTFSVAYGSLPKGVRLDSTTGVISGTPSVSGRYSAVVEAKNAAGSSSTTVWITVPEVKDLLDTKNHVAPVAVGAAKVPLKVAGLKKGEHWTVKVDGKVVEHGTMKKAGTLSVSVHLKKVLRDKVHTITIAGSRAVTDKSTRAATTVKVTSLAARKKLTVHTVSANGTKLVAVEKLAAGEHVVVKDGAKVIASGNASEYGIFAFPQSKAGKGTSKLTVHGAAAKRAGKLTVKNPKH